MQDRSKATSITRRRPVAALIAAVLVLALAFMGFEPGALRSAFADEGTAASAAATHQQAGGEQATEHAEADPEGEPDPAGGEGDDAIAEDPAAGQAQTPSGEGTPEEVEQSASADDADGIDARAGPDGGESPGEEAQTAASGPADEQPKASSSDEPAREAGETGRKIEARTSDYASATITFYGNVATENPSILARKLVSAKVGQTVRVDVSDVVASPPTSSMAFDGWLHGGQVFSDAIEVDPREGNVRLYPAFSAGHWLRYIADVGGNGAVEVPSRFVGAAEQAPAALPTTTLEGYAFEGWFEGTAAGEEVSYGEQVTRPDGTVIDPAALKAKLAVTDVELYAKWTGSNTTYRVITWHENPDDDGFSYEGAELIGDEPGERAISGEWTSTSGLPEVDGFTLQPVVEARIAGDGSTVVHAKYNRNRYKIEFYEGLDTNSHRFDELTIEAKYGEDVQTRWPNPTEGADYTSSWYTMTDPNDRYTFVNGISTMPLGGANFFMKNMPGTDLATVFMIQDVSGENEFSPYLTQLFSAKNVPRTTADDYMPVKGFVVNAASQDDAELIRNNPTGDPMATHDPDFKTSVEVHTSYNVMDYATDASGKDRRTAYFYYLRCQYDIVFEENGGPETPDANDVYYGAQLAGLQPEGYVVGETTYTAANGEVREFAGWYADAFYEELFDFDSASMPANNIVLYAKWEPVKYLVQVDPAGGEFTNEEQSTYFWVGHGDTVGYIGAERHYVADDDGTHVYDYETYDTDEGADEFGAAGYVAADPDDTGQRYSYSEDAYSLYGWFRADAESPSQAPFDFGQAITEDTSIAARWQAAGTFDIAYDPTVDVAGVTVGGDIETIVDEGYADLSPTVVMNTPVNIEADDGGEYAFLGWQVVESFEEGSAVLVDDLLLEGDGFMVDSNLATNNTIHMQAVYEQAADDPADPSDPTDTVDPSDLDDSGASSGSQADGDSGDSEASGGSTGTADAVDSVAGDASGQQFAGGKRALLPKTADGAQSLAMAIGAIALLSLVVALVARAMRRSHVRDE